MCRFERPVMPGCPTGSDAACNHLGRVVTARSTCSHPLLSFPFLMFKYPQMVSGNPPYQPLDAFDRTPVAFGSSFVSGPRSQIHLVSSICNLEPAFSPGRPGSKWEIQDGGAGCAHHYQTPEPPAVCLFLALRPLRSSRKPFKARAIGSPSRLPLSPRTVNVAEPNTAANAACLPA